MEVNRTVEPQLSTYMSTPLWKPSRRRRVLATATALLSSWFPS